MIISLQYQPPKRYDSVPWVSATIQEAVTEQGEWTDIDTIEFDPVDADPSHPQMRALMTNEASLEQGWYRVVFTDAADAESQPTKPRHNVADSSADIRPSVDELGSFMRARTKGEYTEQGTFNTQTRPTGVQADALLDQAAMAVALDIGDVPDHLLTQARYVVLLLAAQLVEVSYYPEQSNDDQSAFALYQSLYEGALISLRAAVQDNQPGRTRPRFFSVPVYGRNGYKPNETDIKSVSLARFLAGG